MLTYNLGYSFFWTTVFVLQFIGCYIVINNILVEYFKTISVFLLASRGIWSLTIISIAHFDELREKLEIITAWRLAISSRAGSLVSNPTSQITNEGPLQENIKPQLSDALRSEVITLTTLGIRKAVVEYERQAILGGVSNRGDVYSLSFIEKNSSAVTKENLELEMDRHDALISLTVNEIHQQRETQGESKEINRDDHNSRRLNSDFQVGSENSSAAYAVDDPIDTVFGVESGKENFVLNESSKIELRLGGGSKRVASSEFSDETSEFDEEEKETIALVGGRGIVRSPLSSQ